MEELQRVDIKIDKELLKFAGAKAALVGISRRQYLADVLTEKLLRLREFSEEWGKIIEDGYATKHEFSFVKDLSKTAKIIPNEKEEVKREE